MKVSRHFARRFRLLGVLRGSLALGALVDLAAAVALVVAPGSLGPFGRIDTPRLEGAAVVPWLVAVLLAMLAGLWAQAAHDPRRYSGIVVVAIVGRLAGAAVVGSWAVIRPELAGLWAFAIVLAVFGLLHAATWIPLRI